MGCMQINKTKLKWQEVSSVGGFLSRFDFENPKQCLCDYTTMPRSTVSNAGSITLKVHVYLFTLLG